MSIRRSKFGILFVVLGAIALMMIPLSSSFAAKDGKIIWKSSGHGPASDPSQIFHDKLCNAITEATGGRLTVKPFVGGSIVPAYKEVDAIDQGVLQMGYSCPMYNLDKWSAAGLISSRPGGLPGEAMRTWFDYGGGADLMNKMMGDYNVMTFPGALAPLPEEVFFHSKVKLESLADLKGLKARCMGDGGEILKRMGAATVIIPGGQLYEAMQRGTIDAFEYSTLASNWNMHFNEVAPYVYLSPSRAPSDPQVIFVNKKAFNELPADLQMTVRAVVAKFTQDQHEYLVSESIKAVDKFKAAGNEVYKVPKEIEDALQVEADKFYAEKSKSESPIFAEIYNSMKNFGEAYNAIK
ncbi:MAG: TRAP transporter substrate-binding protein DctP [Deltaproteobacteria bacterium]|jgi:TRAP-type mannitol/chloroaromatic compound transport system substrate-binding protein|nr:TRAP transporter substrate-binding protein DctP [Deltaproteobacteria bacterium]MCW8891834.1 TRAP transporter substrate-binding protein DctP [Deltaproteobacteria bacterium]MCW9050389.1 TRAP transporter substrate-binding protein DctP [Deltaproteobacteria bacterium]